MRIGKAITLNISQIFLAITMLLLSPPNYDNLLYIFFVNILMFLSGIISFLYLEIKYKHFKMLLYLEAMLIGLFYLVFQNLDIYIFIFYEILIFIGIKYKHFSEMVLIDFFLITFGRFHLPSCLGSDAMILSYYAAYLFLHGQNPYDPFTTANVYSFFHLSLFSPIIGTPLTTGGYVTRYDYPSLQMLILIPSVLLNFNPNLTSVFFYMLIPIVLYLDYKKSKDCLIFVSFLLPYIFNINYYNFAVGGISSADWMFFTILSMLSKDDRLKGIFYGIAVSFKQTPLALLPFYLIYLRKEGRPLAKFLLYALLSFLLINGYFILISPSYYFEDLLYPIVQPLLGVGIGISMISYTGFFYIYRTFFTLAIVIVVLTEIYLLLRYYNILKDSWTMFPYFIFFVNYRSWWNYFPPWPVIAYGLKEEKIDYTNTIKTKIDYKILSIPLLVIIGLSLFFHYDYSCYYTSIKVSVIKVCKEPGMIYGIILNISYEPKSSRLPSYITPYFRILPDTSTISANGFIYCSNSTTLYAGHWEIVKLYPSYPGYTIPDVPLRIEAYYGNLIGIANYNP